jgi:hypothetical protein
MKTGKALKLKGDGWNVVKTTTGAQGDADNP